MRSWAEIVHDLQTNSLIYLAFPVVAGLIGYFTKLVAIKMMFRPHKYKGIRPFGWQGIIPRRAPQMVDVLCETLTGRLISSAEIVGRIDSKMLAKKMERPLRREIRRIVPEVADEYQPAAWRMLPGPAQDVIVQRAQDVAVDMVPKLVKALRKNIDDVFDLKQMVTAEFLSDPDILERMFLDVGRREFAFIRRSGLVFGFVIGIVQAGIWAMFHQPLIMPAFGLFIGWFTDWAALRLIFTPREPKKYLGVVTWQGLFLKHRIPVSEEYGSLIATRVLTSGRLVKAVFTGPRRDDVVTLFAKVIEKELRQELFDADKAVTRELSRFGLPAASDLDATGGAAGSLLGAVTDLIQTPIRRLANGGMDAAQVGPMARTLAEELVAAMPEIVDGSLDYLGSAMDIEKTMSQKMVAMTPEQFENVLRPAFRADERTLIMVGAILGFLVGELQVLMVEHLTH